MATSISTLCRGVAPSSVAITGLLVLATLARAQPQPLPDHAFAGRTYPSHWARAPLLDHARAAARVDVAWQRFGVLGRGATICVIDTGVDLTHRDFRDATDHTRVDWLLDLDHAPRGSEPALEARFGGAVYRGGELDAMLAARDATLPTDWHGHGTAVASAALGDDAPAGVIDPGPFAGVAPLARLVVVRTLRRGMPGFADDDIARGVGFCAAVTDRAHAVALLSLGGHDGAHDGTSAIELTLAEQMHAGLAIVVAAGNDGGRAIHAAARIALDQVVRITLRIPTPQGALTPHVAVALRGATEVALVAPGGSRVSVRAQGDRASVATSHGRLTLDASRSDVIDATIAADAVSPLVGGDFTIELRGPARADAWIVSSDVGTALLAPVFVGPSVVPGEEITMPATCDAVIAVGASVSRAALVTMDGSPTLALEADGEGRALFSSRGPSASGAARPDILAPGGWIVAARSNAVDPSDPEALVHGHVPDWSRLLQPNDRIAVAGTSFSAAIVAGAIALAAERSPIDPERDRELLAFTATRATETAFTSSRGFGALDAAAFLAARGAMHSGGASSGAMSASRAFTTPGATDLTLALIARAADGSVPDDAWIVITRDGSSLAHVPLRAGIARAPIALVRAPAGTRVTFGATTERGTPLATSVVDVAWSEDDGDAWPAGGAGCAIARERSFLGVALAAFAIVVAHARRRCARRGCGASSRRVA